MTMNAGKIADWRRDEGAANADMTARNFCPPSGGRAVRQQNAATRRDCLAGLLLPRRAAQEENTRPLARGGNLRPSARYKYGLGLKIALAALLILALLSLPLNLGNEYLRSNQFETIAIGAGETLNGIAGRYADSAVQRERLAAAIAEVNGLNPAVPLRAGRKIMIPVLK